MDVCIATLGNDAPPHATIKRWALDLTLSQKKKILDSSNLKGFADDNYKFDENGRKFPRWVQNTSGKGKIAHNEQFSFSRSFFKRLVLQTSENQGLFGKGLIMECRDQRMIPIVQSLSLLQSQNRSI